MELLLYSNAGKTLTNTWHVEAENPFESEQVMLAPDRPASSLISW